jgi:hypothetical protein
MADLVVVLGVLAFFAVCVLLVIGLDRLVGPDDGVVVLPDDATLDDAAILTEAAR